MPSAHPLAMIAYHWLSCLSRNFYWSGAFPVFPWESDHQHYRGESIFKWCHNHGIWGRTQQFQGIMPAQNTGILHYFQSVCTHFILSIYSLTHTPWDSKADTILISPHEEIGWESLAFDLVFCLTQRLMFVPCCISNVKQNFLCYHLRCNSYLPILGPRAWGA